MTETHRRWEAVKRHLNQQGCPGPNTRELSAWPVSEEGHTPIPTPTKLSCTDSEGLWAVPPIYHGSVGCISYHSPMEPRQRQPSVTNASVERGRGWKEPLVWALGRGMGRMEVEGAW